jgi:hypothetical protein
MAKKALVAWNAQPFIVIGATIQNCHIGRMADPILDVTGKREMTKHQLIGCRFLRLQIL